MTKTTCSDRISNVIATVAIVALTALVSFGVLTWP